MKCAIVSGASIAAAETAVNDWLSDKINSGEGVDVKFASMSEGSIGTATIKVIIFYDEVFTYNPRS